jgi:hypothetical protein
MGGVAQAAGASAVENVKYAARNAITLKRNRNRHIGRIRIVRVILLI